MADRFPTPAGEASQRDIIHDALYAMHHGEPPFDYQDADGQLIGCYASMPYTPHITPQAFALMQSIYTPATLPARTRQMGILAVAAAHDVPYVRYCHQRVSPKLGFSAAQFRDAVAGTTPAGVSEAEAVAYETALLLARDRRPLDHASWERACRALGREGLAGLANVVAGYQYVCTLAMVAGPEPGGWTPEGRE